VIVGFRDRRTEAFHQGRRVAAFPGFTRTASRKPDRLGAATVLGDLARSGNRLEALRDRRRGHWNIRVNDRWRVRFAGFRASPSQTEVEIVDCH